MFILGNIILAFAKVLDVVLDIMWILILVRALISWVNPDPYNPIVQFLNRTTEPILAPIRRLLPMHNLGIDISPIIAFVAIIFAQTAIVQSLAQIGHMLQ